MTFINLNESSAHGTANSLNSVAISSASDGIRAGARAFIHLMGNIKTISDATCIQGEDDSDARDYRAIADLIEKSIQRNLSSEAREEHREGYLRALTDLITLNVDGCGPDHQDWDPIAATSKAFAGQGQNGLPS